VAKQFPRIGLGHRKMIEAQKVFFVATAAETGRVNLSPKGMDSLRVLGPNRIAWLNVTGSGNETAGHLRQSPRMTLMWCSFDAAPMILRAYGTARAIHRKDADWDALAALFPGGPEKRQVFDMEVETVQTSCGYAVPLADGLTERDTLKDWAARKGETGLRDYWADRNARTLDGAPTGIEDNL
jgi:hypothetical protein